MKKFLLLFSAVLFLGSCTDMSVSEEDAIKDALPKDFKWEMYAEINSDVKLSQVVFKIRDEIAEREASAADVRNNCFDILNDDLDFAKQIYVDFVGCPPEEGWNKNETCTGKYANNSSYSTDTSCSIGVCWHGGWSELGAAALDPQLKTLESFLLDSLESYKNNSTGRTSVGVIPLMCGFVPLASDAGAAKSHLESLASNTIPELVELHYFDQGRYDGRPYKYCSGQGGEPKDRDKHAIAKQASGQPADQFYYDYSAYLFCLEESDWIIYTTTEKK